MPEYKTPPKPELVNKRTIAIIVGVGLLIIAVFFWRTFLKIPAETKKSNTIELNGGKPLYQQIDKNTLPPGIPKDLPQESGSEVLQNNTVSLGKDEFQSIHVFTSSKSVEQNYQIYYDYLKKNGWPVGKVITTDKLKYVSIIKNDSTTSTFQHLFLTISKASNGAGSVVNFTLITSTSSPLQTIPIQK